MRKPTLIFMLSLSVASCRDGAAVVCSGPACEAQLIEADYIDCIVKPGPQSELTAVVCPSQSQSKGTLAETLVARPTVFDANRPLVVLLPGGGSTPDNHLVMVEWLRAQGFAVIALGYETSLDLRSRCLMALPADRDCARGVYDEVITGADVSSVIAIPPAEAVEPRLAAAVHLLGASDPTWLAYLDETTGLPRWPRIIVTGLSQGGVVANQIARIREVERAVSLSAPTITAVIDPNRLDRKGAVVIEGNQMSSPVFTYEYRTPTDRLYVLSHRSDTQIQWHRGAAASLGLPAASRVVDDPTFASIRCSEDPRFLELQYLPPKTPSNPSGYGHLATEMRPSTTAALRAVLEPALKHAFGLSPCDFAR